MGCYLHALVMSLFLTSCRAANRVELQRFRGGALFSLPPLVSAYQSALVAAPLATNVVTASGLSVLADGMAQAVEQHGAEVRSWDHSRAAWISVWGAAVSGCMLFFWFRLLAYLFPLAASRPMQLLGKVALNQAVMSPGLNAGFFTFAILTREAPILRLTAEKRTLLCRKLREDLPRTIRRSCYFWSVAQTINFRYMPLAYNTLWTNACFLIWTTYISWVGFRRVDRSPSQGDHTA